MAEILYFASLAETLGARTEQLALPADCHRITDLVVLFPIDQEQLISEKARLLCAGIFVADNISNGRFINLKDHQEVSYAQLIGFPP